MKRPALESLVPTGKAIMWLLTAGSMCVMAGVGATLTLGEYRVLPEQVRTLAASDTAQERALMSLRDSVATTTRELRRIRCLTVLSVTGQTVNPLEIDRICP